MSKFTTPLFWNKFIRIFLPFFILLVVISLILNSSRDIFSGDFAKVATDNFANGEWVRFFGYKFGIAFVYALFVTNKNLK